MNYYINIQLVYNGENFLYALNLEDQKVLELLYLSVDVFTLLNSSFLKLMETWERVSLLKGLLLEKVDAVFFQMCVVGVVKME